MAIETGTIKSVVIDNGGFSIEVDFGAGVVETCAFYENAGNNNYPLYGDEVAVSMSEGQNTIMAVFRTIPDGLGKGEQVIYSRNADGEVQATLKATADGELILNEGDDFAVKFNELKGAFDELKNYVNALVLPVNIPAATAGPPAVPSTADMSSSKVEKVKL